MGYQAARMYILHAFSCQPLAKLLPHQLTEEAISIAHDAYTTLMLEELFTRKLSPPSPSIRAVMLTSFELDNVSQPRHKRRLFATPTIPTRLRAVS